MILPTYYPQNTSSSSGATTGGSTAKTGNITFTSDSSKDTFVIPHGMGSMPSYANVVAKNPTAIGDYSVIWDGTNITMMYSYAPPSGTIVLTWIVVQ